jgi:hypothetical protein
MRTLTIAISFAVLALAAAGTAGATAPTTTHASFPRSLPHYLPCTGFWIDGEFQIDRTTTTFYDQAGTPIRTVSHVRSEGTLSNPLTGTSIADSGDFKITIDLLTGERTGDGKGSVATAPGVGVIYQSVGHLVFNPDGSISAEGGPHDDIDGNYDALCSYLTGP